MLNQKGIVSLQLSIFFFVVGIIFIFILIGLPLQHSMVLLLASIVFIIAFLNADLALVVVILSMLLSPEVRAGEVASRNVNIRIEDLFLFVIFFGWMAKMAVKKELGVVRSNPLNGPIMVYIGICLISSLIGMMAGRVQLRESIFYLLKYFEYFLIFFMVGNNLRTFKQARIFFFFIMLTCFLVCIIAWLQIPSGARISAPFESEGGEPNTFAGYLLLMMSMILGFFIYAQKRREKILWFCFFLFTFIPFVLTLSREGWFSFVPLLLMYIFLSRKARYPLIIFLVVSTLLLPYITPKKVQERAQDTFSREQMYDIGGKKFYVSGSTAARLDAGKQAMVKLAMRPFLGAGVPGGAVIDNQYTRVLIETGLIGFLAFMWMISLLFRLVMKVYRQAEDNFSKSLSIGFICGFVALLVQSLGGAVFILIRIMEPFWFIAAMVLALPEVEAEEKVLAYDK